MTITSVNKSNNFNGNPSLKDAPEQNWFKPISNFNVTFETLALVAGDGFINNSLSDKGNKYENSAEILSQLLDHYVLKPFKNFRF